MKGKCLEISLSLSLTALALPAAAETCAFDQAGWALTENDLSRPADNIVLLSIGLDAEGEFEVTSAQSRSGVADWSWQIAGLQRALRPHAPPAADNVTPFDLTLSGDTIVVFQLEPGAWSFEPSAEKALFLKARADGSPYPHNPFSSAKMVGGNSRLFAARFHAPQSLSGCAYAYNLGVVVKQGGNRTPLVIDPRIKNDGTGN